MTPTTAQKFRDFVTAYADDYKGMLTLSQLVEDNGSTWKVEFNIGTGYFSGCMYQAHKLGTNNTEIGGQCPLEKGIELFIEGKLPEVRTHG